MADIAGFSKPVPKRTCVVEQSRFKRNAIALYDAPLSFWNQLLGADLHFNLGYFSADDTTLPESMNAAVHRLLKASLPVFAQFREIIHKNLVREGIRLHRSVDARIRTLNPTTTASQQITMIYG